MLDKNNQFLQIRILWVLFVLAVIVYMILMAFPSLIFLLFRVSSEKYDINKFSGFVPEFSKFKGFLTAVFFVVSLCFLLLAQKINPRGIIFVDDLGKKANNVSKYVLSFALSESIAIMGLVLFLIIGVKISLYVFGTLSLISLFLCYPRK